MIVFTDREQQYLMSMIANRLREIRGRGKPGIEELLERILTKVRTGG